RRSTNPERSVVLHILRPGKARPCLRGSASALDGHCGNDGRLLAEVDDRRTSVRAVLGLGQFCQRVEFYDLAAECVGAVKAARLNWSILASRKKLERRGRFELRRHISYKVQVIDEIEFRHGR